LRWRRLSASLGRVGGRAGAAGASNGAAARVARRACGAGVGAVARAAWRARGGGAGAARGKRLEQWKGAVAEENKK